MNYGTLNTTDRTTLDGYLQDRLQEPSYAIFIEGIGDVGDYVISISTDVSIENVAGTIGVGYATVYLDNVDDTFYATGESKVDDKAAVRIWAGYGGLNVPIFTGFVQKVTPIIGYNSVYLHCQDNMGLFLQYLVDQHQESNNTPKLIMENFCSQFQLGSDIASTDELDATYDDPSFDHVFMRTALDEVARSIFHVCYFDESGTLQAREREYSDLGSWTFDDKNVWGDEGAPTILSPSGIINDVTVEYAENFWVRYVDQASVDKYGTRSRWYRARILNSVLVSSKTQGYTDEELDNDLEGFKITSASGSAFIDCVHVALRQAAASGYITLKIYSDSGGDPDKLLGTSRLKAAAGLYGDHSWGIFYFVIPIEISGSTDYWGIIDTSDVTGTVYARISVGTASAKHAYYSGGWTTENNKQILHRVRGSAEAKRIAEDIVRFSKEPKERIQVGGPGVPILSLMDRVLVDVDDETISGYYTIERRQHKISPSVYETVEYLRRS